MPYTKEQVARIEEIYQTVEGNKPHEHAAPTYKDSPLLREMAEIALSNTDEDIDALEDRLGAMWYLCECYTKMCRPAMNDKFYKVALECHVKRSRLTKYDKHYTGLFEDAFYDAVKARTYYEPDDCEDLKEIVKGTMTDEKIAELYKSAVESRSWRIKNDPIEKTDRYLAVIDEVEQLIDENKTMDFCLEYWSMKADYLAERGIYWRSPALLNPNVMFD